MRAQLMAFLQNLAVGLTRKRVRGHATLLGIVLWGAYAVNIATPGLKDREGQLKGTDFLHFYVLGHIAQQHDGNALYDPYRQAVLARELIRQDPGEVFLPAYGPQYSLLFLPLARLPYGWAAALWMLANALIYGLCAWTFFKACPHLRDSAATVFTLAVSFPGFFYLIGSGQNSAIALIAFTLAFFCLRGNHLLLAGMAIGLLAYKPQFGIMAAVIFILTLEWRVIVGALITGAGQLALGMMYYGKPVLGAYFRNLMKMNASAYEPHLERMQSLRSFWDLLLPWPHLAFILYSLTALLVVILTLRCWRSPANLQLRYAIFLLGTVLVDPHLTDYDLVILMPAFLFIGNFILQADESNEREVVKLLLYAAYCLPLFGVMLKPLHFQLSVLAYSCLFYLVAILALRACGDKLKGWPTLSAPAI